MQYRKVTVIEYLDTTVRVNFYVTWTLVNSTNRQNIAVCSLVISFSYTILYYYQYNRTQDNIRSLASQNETADILCS